MRVSFKGARVDGDLRWRSLSLTRAPVSIQWRNYESCHSCWHFADCRWDSGLRPALVRHRRRRDFLNSMPTPVVARKKLSCSRSLAAPAPIGTIRVSLRPREEIRVRGHNGIKRSSTSATCDASRNLPIPGHLWERLRVMQGSI